MGFIVDFEHQESKKLMDSGIKLRTITKILFNEQMSNNHVKETDQYLPDKKFYFMRKFLDEENKEISLSDYAIESWLNAFIYPPISCFSYGEDEGIHDLLSDINQSINRYLPFIEFYKDKKDVNIFKKLKDVIDIIKSADVVVLLINKSYLESFYAMDEMHDLFTRYKNTNDKVCLIPFVRDNARSLIFNNEGVNEIKLKWKSHIDSAALTQGQKGKALHISESLDDIIIFIRETYNHLLEKAHYDNDFRSMAWVIYRHLVDHAICDIYANITDYNQFPKLK